MTEPTEGKAKSASEMSSGEQLLGCLVLLIPLALLGQCVFGGTGEPKQAEAPAPAAVSTTADRGVEEASPAPPTTLLEQAILDAFPSTPPKTKKERQTASNAADFVGATINAAGYLCARPVEAQLAATGMYGVGCMKYRSGGPQVNYLVSVENGTVTEI